MSVPICVSISKPVSVCMRVCAGAHVRACVCVEKGFRSTTNTTK